MRNSVLKNVVFDLSGVVLVRRKNDREQIEKSFFSFLNNGEIPACWRAFDAGSVTQHEVAEEIARLCGWSPNRVNSEIVRLGESLVESDPVVALIRALSDEGYALYVLSNMPREFYDRIRRFDVFRFFDGVVVSCNEHCRKPDEAFFRILFERYGIRPQESLFVDDRAGNVSVARSLGMEAIRFEDPCVGCEAVCRKLNMEPVYGTTGTIDRLVGIE